MNRKRLLRFSFTLVPTMLALLVSPARRAEAVTTCEPIGECRVRCSITPDAGSSLPPRFYDFVTC